MIEIFYTLLFIGLIFSVLLVFVPIPTITRWVNPYTLIAIFISSIYLFYKFGHQHVEYSSDGEVLNIKTQDAFWVKYFPQTRRIVDFPKSKLISYKVKNSLLNKKLELYVTSRRTQSGFKKLSFNITYLNKSEISDLKRSLNKIVKRNADIKTSQLEEVN
ncbi:hypothetical protein [Moheibacter lacus]|uniref:Uncharacterized protein n=1 Tax=Moheibacter lacus TaxID=2745851 RepID=A0A838ZMB4_9FLAO|nr:hypothetical protein [Moheibacter lacus]MBA5628726.1 hypothetical protein [Moheibacter lacus]